MLYIGEVKFVNDERFELIKGSEVGDWTLRLSFADDSDAGDYECQISTSPKLSKMFKLNVVGKLNDE
jgi:neurotrimin